MSSEKKSSASNGELSSTPWVRRKLGKHWLASIMLVVASAVIQAGVWGLFLTRTRSVDTLTLIGIIVAVFVITAQVTRLTALTAVTLDDIAIFNWVVVVVVLNAFVLITVMFAMLYWTIGTTMNFSVELSRVDSIYFALGTLTTAGTGTIAPISDLARGLVSGQMILDLAFVAGVLTIAITRWSEKST